MTVTADSVSERFLPLSDPAEALPPTGALEVYFETPVSLGMLLTFAEERGYRELTEAAVRAHAEAVRDLLWSLARNVHLKVGEHTGIPGRPSMGRYLPGRIPLTVVSHTHVPDCTDVARFHDHVFIGRRGIADVDGRWWPIDLDSLHKNIRVQAVTYNAALKKYLRDVWGMRWSDPAERTWMGFDELVEPNFAPSVADYPRRLCPYGYGQSSDRLNVVDILERL